MNRADIKNADYNPRAMDGEARQKLSNSLDRNGLIEPLVWNKQTGNLVGGHQRIRKLDLAEGSNQYRVPVAIVDVGLREEKAMNLALNNLRAQGDFTQEGLHKLLVEDKIDYLASGYDGTDLNHLFGKDQAQALLQVLGDKSKAEEGSGNETPGGEEEKAGTSELDDKMKGMLARHEAILRSFNHANDREFYYYLMFPTDAHREALARILGIDVNKRHMDGETLIGMLGLSEKFQAELQKVLKERGVATETPPPPTEEKTDAA